MRLPSLGGVIPAGPSGRRLALISFIDSIGTGLFLAGSAVFAVRTVGLSTAQFGWAMSIAGLVGLAVGVPLAGLGDRVGPRRLLVLVQLWRAVWFCALAFAGGFSSFVLSAVCLAAAEAVVPPLTQSVVASAVGAENRVRTMAGLRALRNAGFSIGALAAAPLLAADTVWTYRSILLADAASFVFAASVLARLVLPDHLPAVKKAGGALKALAGLRDMPYLRLAGLNGILTMHMSILSIGFPLWLVTATEAPVGLVAILTAINTVMAVTLQVPLSRGAESGNGATRALFTAGAGLAGCCLALAAAGSVSRWPAVALLVVAMAALTFGEIYQSAGGWELSYRYAHSDRQVEYLAVFNTGLSLQGVIGPILLTGVVIALGPWGWTALAAVFCLAALLVRQVAGSLAESRVATADR